MKENVTRLTKDVKAKIADAAVNATFKTKCDAQQKAAAKMGMELYNHVFDAATRRAAAKMPEGWLRLDACLRFNCGGFDLRFRVDPAAPVPHNNGYCGRLGDVSGEIAERAQAVAVAGENLSKEKHAALRALSSMLDSISTVSQLEKTWPEGEPFYRRFKETKPGASLPAVQVSAINEMLGLKEAA